MGREITRFGILNYRAMYKKAGELFAELKSETRPRDLVRRKGALEIGGLPLGLAHNVKLVRAIKAGAPVSWSDVIVDEASSAVKVRREMEKLFAVPTEAALI